MSLTTLFLVKVAIKEFTETEGRPPAAVYLTEREMRAITADMCDRAARIRIRDERLCLRPDLLPAPATQPPITPGCHLFGVEVRQCFSAKGYLS
jgi:hypothetical protein